MKKETKYIIENEIIANEENQTCLIEIFNKKLATIILNIENKLNDQTSYHMKGKLP